MTFGREGKVKAGISACEIIVIGSVCGNLNGSSGVDIRSEGSVTGDVFTQRIRIENGAYFKSSIDIWVL
ncbi:MAG: polymer-forming cytoskeletal protein [Candidatus Angelobacter sp.]